MLRPSESTDFGVPIYWQISSRIPNSGTLKKISNFTETSTLSDTYVSMFIEKVPTHSGQKCLSTQNTKDEPRYSMELMVLGSFQSCCIDCGWFQNSLTAITCIKSRKKHAYSSFKPSFGLLIGFCMSKMFRTMAMEICRRF